MRTEGDAFFLDLYGVGGVLGLGRVVVCAPSVPRGQTVGGALFGGPRVNRRAGSWESRWCSLVRTVCGRPNLSQGVGVLESMRSHFKQLRLFSALVGLGLCAPASAAAVSGPVFASPDSARLIVLAEQGRLEVRVPGRPARSLTVPAGCQITAVTRTEAFLCSQTQGGPLAVDLRTGAAQKLPVQMPTPTSPNETLTFELARAGTRWLEGTVERRSSDGGSSLFEAVLVDRRTGRMSSPGGKSTGRWGPTRYFDLNARQVDRQLCAPIRRAAADEGGFGVAFVQGDWTLRQDDTEFLLQRCGQRRVAQRTRTGLSVVLGTRHLAWVSFTSVHLRTLKTGRVRTFPLAGSPASTSVALSNSRLAISSQSPGEIDVRTIPLG